MPLSRLPRHAAVAFVAAAALTAPPAARAADAVYGGTTKDGDAIVVTADQHAQALRSLGIAYLAHCAGGSKFPGFAQLTPTVAQPGFQPDNGDLIVTRNAKGRFSGTQLAAFSSDTMTGAIVVTLAGTLGPDRARGTIAVDVNVFDKATGNPVDTCSVGKRSWNAARSPGVIYGGETAQGAPLVLRLDATRRRIADVLFSWQAPCTPDGFFFSREDLGNWTVKPTGAFGGPFGNDLALDAGAKRHLDYKVAGRVTKTAAKGSIQVKVADTDAAGTPGSACDTGNIAWKARTG
jgi:hypothetical protein